MIIKIGFINIRTGVDAPEKDFNKQIEKNRREYAKNRAKASAFVLWEPQEYEAFTVRVGDGRECPASRRARKSSNRVISLKPMVETGSIIDLTQTFEDMDSLAKKNNWKTVATKPLTGKKLISAVKSLQGHLKAVKEKYGITPDKGNKSKEKPNRTSNKGITPKDLRNARGKS